MKTVNKVGQAEKEHIPTCWSYGLKVMILDCRSGDQGSSPCRVVSKRNKIQKGKILLLNQNILKPLALKELSLVGKAIGS